MTQKKNLLTALFALALSLAFMGCSEDPQPAYEYKSQGYIKGTLNGVTKDNAYTFNETFNYTQYNLSLNETGATYSVDGSAYEFVISRSDFNGTGSATFAFTLANATAKPVNNDVYYDFSYNKEEKDRFIVFSMESDDENTLNITDFTFDTTTGRVTGKYTITGTENTTDKAATITGDFDVIAKKVVR